MWHIYLRDGTSLQSSNKDYLKKFLSDHIDDFYCIVRQGFKNEKSIIKQDAIRPDEERIDM